MNAWPRGTRIAIGVVAAVAVPFLVTGFYRLIDLPSVFLLPAPFALLAALALYLWRSTTWKALAIGVISGALIYGVFLVALLFWFMRGFRMPE